MLARMFSLQEGRQASVLHWQQNWCNEVLTSRLLLGLRADSILLLKT